MPRQGNGTYTLPSGNPVVSGTVILSAWANTTMSDIAAALTGSIARDGQSAPTANLPMAGFRLTGVGLGNSLTDLARVSQVQDNSLCRCSAEANTADAYSASLPFGSTSFVNGQIVVLQFPASNTTTSPTLNINGSVAWPILRADGSSIQVGDCNTGIPSRLLWNSTAWLLLGTGGGGGSSGVSSFNSRMGAVSLLSADVTGALTYVPVNKAGDTFSGPVVLAGDASGSLQPTTLQQVLSLISSIPTVAGVSSFNSRTGVVTLTGTDVTNALTYIPVQSFNGRSGVVTLTSGDVTTALSYTPVSRAGDTMTGTLNGTTASFKRYPANAVATTQTASLDFSVNTTQEWTLSGDQTISSVTGLADGDEGVMLVTTNNKDITWPSSFKWDHNTNPTTPYAAPNINLGPLNIVTVSIRRIGSLYYCHADLY